MQLEPLVTVSIALGLTAMTCAWSQSKATIAAAEGMARQPEASGDIRVSLLLALAFIEALTLYVLVFAILVWTKVG